MAGLSLLGNEPDLWPAHHDMSPVSPSQLGRDFINFRNILRDLYWPHFKDSLLVGPDTASPGAGFTTEFLNVCGDVINATTFHHYYGGGPSLSHVDNYTDPKVLDGYRVRAREFISYVNASNYPSVPMWNGETSSTFSPTSKFSSMT